MIRRRLAPLLLALALLAGWQAALEHPITHVDALAALSACAAAAPPARIPAGPRDYSLASRNECAPRAFP